MTPARVAGLPSRAPGPPDRYKSRTVGARAAAAGALRAHGRMVVSCPTGLEARAEGDNRAWHSFQGGGSGGRGRMVRAQQRDNSDLDSDIAAAARNRRAQPMQPLLAPAPAPPHLGRSDGGNRGTRSLSRSLARSSVARLVSE